MQCSKDGDAHHDDGVETYTNEKFTRIHYSTSRSV